MDYRQTIGLLLAAAIAPSSAGVALAAECDEVLKRTAAKVAASYNSIHTYTCVETIQRDYYRPRGNTLPRDCQVLMQQRQHPTIDMALLLGSRDRLRLEVATSSRGEINSWPGASRFADSGIETLVREGPIGTGAFGTLLSLMFTSDVKKFGFVGDVTEAGRRYLIYTFSVPVTDSHYRVKTQDNSAWLTVGYEGVLHVDAETADPLRVTTVTSNMPLAVGVCQTASTLNFKHDASVGEELLLPVQAGQHFISPNGNETQNTITFSSCRQYSSESSISYYAPPDPAAPAGHAAAKPRPLEIPEWLPFSMELLTTIDTDISAAGDRFSARLATPIRDSRRVIAPKGAMIEGRVSNVEIGFRAEVVAIGLLPETIEIQGAKVPFAARLNLNAAIVAKEQRARKGLQFFLPAPGQVPHEFRLPGTHNVLAKGFLSEWLTAALSRASRIQ
jgi:hypothetical protein